MTTHATTHGPLAREPWEADDANSHATNGHAHPTDARDLEFAALHSKIDALTDAVGRLDRRREELEELIEDLMPAVNGAVLLLRDRLDGLDRNGAWANGREAMAAAETALAGLHADDLHALAAATPDLLRTLRVVTAPEITGLADRFVTALDDAKHGAAPSTWTLLRQARSPKVRRGMGVALSLMKALGEGAHVTPVPVRAAAPRPAAPRPNTASPRVDAALARAGSCGVATPASGPVGSISVGGRSWALDADGFLDDPSTWTKDVAQAFAAEEGITLGDAHWKVLDFVRAEGAATGAAPGIRRIASEIGTTQKELYGLFPGGPGKLAARIAGLKKPKSCV